MASHNELGQEGEKLALQYLINKGYFFVEKNWRAGKDEIDIIVLCPKKERLIFVEVKTRNSDFFGEPHLAVKTKKRDHLIKAANSFIQQNNYDQEAQFDIISIVLNKNAFDLEHIEEAFWPRP